MSITCSLIEEKTDTIVMDDATICRYNRHLMLPEIDFAGQETWSRANVAVIGCGGLANTVLPLLASAGVGCLKVADGDSVELSNLSRQVAFDESCIGHNKARAMKRRLLSLNSTIKVQANETFLTPETLAPWLQGVDLAVDCSDNAKTRHALNQTAQSLKIPLLSGAAIRFSGQVCLFDFKAEKSPCYACLFGEQVFSDGNCAITGVFSPVVAVVGAEMAAMALRYLLNVAQVASLFKQYNGLSGTWQTFNVTADETCNICRNAPSNEV